MIRPVTLFCWILALGSGLYLYRAKHDVELLDRQIAQVARDTETIRGESRRLLDEWIRLGEPEQLRKYSDQYLGLRTMAPTQFVRVADLAAKLPAPRPPSAAEEALTPAPTDAPATLEAEAEDLPIPPVPPEAPGAPNTVVMPAASPREPEVARILSPRPVTPRRPVESQVAEEPRLVAPPRPVAARPPEPRVAEEPRFVPPRPVARQPESRMAEESRPTASRPAATRPSEARVAEEPRSPPPRPVAAHPAEPSRPIEARPVEARSAEPRVQTAQRPAYAPPAASMAPAVPVAAAPRPAGGGSMLGGARGQGGLPLPTPVATTWRDR